MTVQVDHYHMEKMYQCVQNFISKVCEYTRCTVNEHASKDLKLSIEDLEKCLNNVYNPELRSLNEQCVSLYKAYLSLKDVDRTTASQIYSQYLDKKTRSAQLEAQLTNEVF